MLHTNNLKEADISTITKTTSTCTGIGTSTSTTTAATTMIEQHGKPDNSIEGNKGIMSLTRRPTLEQQFNLMGKQRAKNDEHVLATTNNNYSSGSSSSTKRSKSANNKIQKSPKLFNEFNDVNMEQQQKQERITEEQQKLHNNQPLIANIEHLSCQTHALAHTSSNTRPNLAAYSQPYMHHTTNTLSTFKGKNSTSSSGSALSRNSHYFSSLDNRSQRHQEHKHQQQHQHQQQQQQQQHYMQNYSHYRQKKRKQNYDSLLPYSVANLPTLQKTNATYCSTDGSSSEEDAAANETLTSTSTSTTATPLPRTPINKSGTTHYHMSHHKMHQQQQQQQHTKQSTKDNQGHYISPIQAKSTFQQQQQQQIEITSLKQNKRHKIQHRHLPNSQQERT